jgi:hypothetical protein
MHIIQPKFIRPSNASDGDRLISVWAFPCQSIWVVPIVVHQLRSNRISEGELCCCTRAARILPLRLAWQAVVPSSRAGQSVAEFHCVFPGDFFNGQIITLKEGGVRNQVSGNSWKSGDRSPLRLSHFESPNEKTLDTYWPLRNLHGDRLITKMVKPAVITRRSSLFGSGAFGLCK